MSPTSKEGVSNIGVIKRRSGQKSECLNAGVFKRQSHHCLTLNDRASICTLSDRSAPSISAPIADRH